MSLEKLSESQLRAIDFGISEEQEQWTGEHVSWVAGFMTGRGWLGFSIKDSYSYPLLSFYDNDPMRLAHLNRLLGGSIIPIEKPDGRSSGRLDIRSSEHVVWLSSLIRPYTPTLEPIIDRILEWSDEPQRKKRVKIAHAARNYKDSRFLVADDDRWGTLSKNPEFVAGLVDAKASFTASRETPVLYLYDTNEPLIKTLAQTHGGSVVVASPSGTSFSIGESEGVTSHTTYRWQLYAPGLYEFLNNIRDHTLVTRHIVESLVLLY